MHRYHNDAREMAVKATLDRPVPLPAGAGVGACKRGAGAAPAASWPR
ncbi:MAG: hypothetical protein ACOY4L_03830 [Pseudomonadota bacterium]